MRAVVQRVGWARVKIADEIVGEIGPGLLVLLGAANQDTTSDADFLANKVVNLRIFEDDNQNMNRSILETGGSILVVSQFTLYGDCIKGNRPSYIEAAPPELAEKLYEEYVRELKAIGHEVQTGRFRELMLVDIQNDGPVTLLLESRGRMKL